jgi:hypothetical protein
MPTPNERDMEFYRLYRVPLSAILSYREEITKAERERCADRNCAVCEGYYTKTLCGGTKDKPYRPNHCMFRATIMQDKENT